MDNRGLVNFAITALAEKWGYVWGTFGQKLTVDLLTQKCRQYPSEVGGKVEFINKTWMGRTVADCVGLIKGYYWSQNGSFNYDPATDVSADGMFNSAREKGSIDTLPEIPGICLRKTGHIGVYIGGGRVVEARGTYYGVIESSLTDNNPGWTHWLKCPYIDYIVDAPVQQPVNNQPQQTNTWDLYVQGKPASDLQSAMNLFGYRDRFGNPLKVDGQLGDRSNEAMDHVWLQAPINEFNRLLQVVQERLIALGYDLSGYGADGKMSVTGETRRAIGKFQADRGLEQDYITGPITIKELFKI